ncbi:hypothetical protein ABIQ69_11430 [Agromyces sp. G08B096]|uniref:C2H2-type domain-containing protein n=1 Tax=Agromyces sp. G08B096 TaxID=3156399 RepID=A0AAU7W436_9MICO
MNYDVPCRRGCTRADSDDLLPARHGAYCARCWGRIEQALIQAPELASHILGHVNPGGAQVGERVSNSGDDAPLPFNETAHGDVNELYALLVYWCSIWADYLEVRPPAVARRAWRRRSGTVIGLPPTTTSEEGSQAVRYMTGWLRDRLDEILTLAPEDVDEFDEGIRDVWRMNARWPRVERPRFAAAPCVFDGCGQRLAVYPPAFPGDVQRIVCEAGHFYAPDEYDDMVATFVALRKAEGRKAQADAERPERVKATLIAKYLRRSA